MPGGHSDSLSRSSYRSLESDQTIRMGATTPSEKGTPSSLPPLEDQLGSEHQSTELLSVDASPRRLHGWKVGSDIPAEK
jgi:hypothetical protein